MKAVCATGIRVRFGQSRSGRKQPFPRYLARPAPSCLQFLSCFQAAIAPASPSRTGSARARSGRRRVRSVEVLQGRTICPEVESDDDLMYLLLTSWPLSRWGLLGNTTLEFPPGNVNSFHSACANVVARNNVASASTSVALRTTSFGPDPDHTPQERVPAPLRCGRHTIVTARSKHSRD
jgi:hypothetical protein